MKIAVIGSRSVTANSPYGVAMARLVRKLSEQGHIIVTGGAQGVDQIAMANSNQNVVYIPWSKYEPMAVSKYAKSVIVFDPNIHTDWAASVGQHHPTPERLSQSAFKLHARNYGIIQNAECVLALPGASNLGGTGQGMRIAEALGKPLFNLRNKADVAKMRQFLSV